MESFNDSKAPSPETLEAVASVIERAAIGLIGVHKLLIECDDDAIGQPARLALERVVQMLDRCCGALTGNENGVMGNFLPKDDIAREFSRLEEARS